MLNSGIWNSKAVGKYEVSIKKIYSSERITLIFKETDIIREIN